LRTGEETVSIVDTGYTETSLDGVGRLDSFLKSSKLLASPAHHAVILELGSGDYDAQYLQMFADVADQYGDLYYRDFKDGLSGHPELVQSDHSSHPNAAGEAAIVARMLPVVQELVARAWQP
jgi:acyl-CoA thioesterase-1